MQMNLTQRQRELIEEFSKEEHGEDDKTEEKRNASGYLVNKALYQSFIHCSASLWYLVEVEVNEFFGDIGSKYKQLHENVHIAL
ncbi:hypothetical protein AgCh_036708 [Apium graveolens]